MALVKQQIVARMKEINGLTKEQNQKALEAFLEILPQDEIIINGWLKTKFSNVKARDYKNLQNPTLPPTHVAEHVSINFSAGKTLKDEVALIKYPYKG